MLPSPSPPNPQRLAAALLRVCFVCLGESGLIEKSLGDAKGKQSNINIWTWILDDLKYFFPFTVSSMQDSLKGGVDDIF